MTDMDDSARLRPPGDSRAAAPPPSGTGETPSSTADDALRSRAAAEPPSTATPSDAGASAPSSTGSTEGGSAAPPAPNAVQRAGTAIDGAVDSAVVATANVPVALPIAQLVDRTLITPLTAIMQGPPPEAGGFGIARYAIDSIAGVAGVVMGVISLPGQLLDTGIAGLSSALVPPGFGFPAAYAGATLHLGVPHTHIPPPAPPVILPSIGDATGPGCLTVMINGMPALRAGDVGFAPTCGSAGVLEIITGSASVFINGKRAARAMDMTRVCNPLSVFSAMAAMSAAMSGLDLAMAALPVVQGALGAAAELETMASSEGAEAEAAAGAAVGQAMNAAMMAAQAAADVATNALRATVGVPPAILPPAPVVLGMLTPIPLGAPVMIGGIPVPPLGDMLNHGISQRRQRIRERRRAAHLAAEDGPHLRPHGGDDSDARPRPHPDDEANQAHCREGHPVDAITGAMFDEYTDYVSEGLFRWVRTYNSQLATTDGPLGRGFRHAYSVSLKALLHRCTYTDELGRETRFPRFDPDMRQVFALGWVLTRETPNRYRLERKGQPTRVFQSIPASRRARLASVVLGARSLDFDYGRDGKLASITESLEGRRQARYLLEHDREGHIAGVMLDGARSALVEHGYDRSGRLTRVRRTDGSSMQYAYDVSHRMTEWTDPTGYAFRWSYDAHNRCVWTGGVDGLLHRRFDYGARSTSVTASDSGVWIHHYRADGILTKKADPLGGTLERLVDHTGRVRTETDSGGLTTELLYDEHDRVEGRRDPFGRLLPSALEGNTPRRPDLRMPSNEIERHLGTTPWRRVDGGADPPVAARDTASWALRTLSERHPEAGYDHLRNIVESVDAMGARRTLRYDGAGELIELRDADGSTWGFRTHRWKLLAHETNPLGHTTRFRYDDEANLTVVIDPLVAMTEYSYDEKRRLTHVRRHGAVQHHYSYDAADRLVERRDGAGNSQLRVVGYDRSRPTLIELASGTTMELTYDSRGRVRTADVIEGDRRIALDCARDDSARVTRDERDGWGLRRRFLHDGSVELTLFGRFSFVTRPTEDGGFLVRGPTGTLQVARLKESSVLERQLGSGSFDLQQFDASGRLVGHVLHRVVPGGGTDVWGARYDRSAEGDLTSVWDSGRGASRYSYDAAHRLVGFEHRGVAQRIDYDPANNLLSKAGVVRAEHSEGNRLSETEDEVFVHDESQRLAARRRRSDGLFTRYHYDIEGQLRRVETRDANGALTCEDWTADYDALGRRVRFGRGSAVTELHWDGFRIAAETAPNGRLRLYAYQAVDSFIPFAFIDYTSRDAAPESGATYYVHHHACGLPLLIEDARGRTVWWASSFDPYGTLDVHPSSAIDYALRWPGHRLDADLDLFYNRFRDYDPKLARYLQPDPLGLGGGPNLYAYATNPLSDVDLLGLTLCPEGVARQKAQMDEARALSEHLPADRRQIVLDSMEEIHRREREFARPGTRAQATEMRGEADATLHMLRESRDPTSPFHGMEPATRYGAGSGMDQIWVRRDAGGNITEAVVIEAKGRNGTSGTAAELSPGNPATALPPQMSTEWIDSRARAIAGDTSASPTKRAAAVAIRDALEDGPPPVVHGRVVTGAFRADEAPTTNPRRRRTDVSTTMAVPERPDGAPTTSTYPADGRHN